MPKFEFKVKYFNSNKMNMLHIFIFVLHNIIKFNIFHIYA